MTLAERIVEQLKERPLTRPQLSILIDEVTSRAILYQLKHLTDQGFVRRGNEACRVYRLIKEEDLLVECKSCSRPRLCWTVTNDVCNYCQNMRWLEGGTQKDQKPKANTAKRKKQRANTRSAQYAKDDASARAFHRLLRGQTIGSLQSNNAV
ncbi:hypothetical protein [Photobacterium minamisatsumaniensis]|uniref:hypothetical protein n=1 Tax=Photobacterium minamisatsumaniensis TaxID=2910233 RepID=UPI003D10DF52